MSCTLSTNSGLVENLNGSLSKQARRHRLSELHLAQYARAPVPISVQLKSDLPSNPANKLRFYVTTTAGLTTDLPVRFATTSMLWTGWSCL